MNSLPTSRKLSIVGPAGDLESIIEEPSDAAAQGVAVVCHPHPQHGGTMHNKVAHTLARAFVRSRVAAVRFNFRGTEGSQGEFDHGVGELGDALAVMDFATEEYPGLPLWLAGFSFGAAISVRAALARPVAGLISVAPAIYRFAGNLEAQPDCPWLIIQGDEDELVEIDETVEWVDSLEPGPELLILQNAEHFFHGRLNELREAVMEFVSREQ